MLYMEQWTNLWFLTTIRLLANRANSGLSLALGMILPFFSLLFRGTLLHQKYIFLAPYMICRRIGHKKACSDWSLLHDALNHPNFMLSLQTHFYVCGYVTTYFPVYVCISTAYIHCNVLFSVFVRREASGTFG